MNKMLCKKIKMTQIWQNNRVIPVTVLQATNETDDINMIKEGSKVVVSGISRGKGFQGVVKRHGFSQQPKTHGQKHTRRAPGSIGPTDPQRTIPGRRMPGRAGGKRSTVKNLSVVKVDNEARTLMIKGAIPGMKNNLVTLRFE